MHPSSSPHNQAGFSLIEMVIAIAVMLVISATVVSLMTSSMSVATTTYELTEAQENLRTAQEFISRDLMSAGDGLKSITSIAVQTDFVEKYLTADPITDPAMPAGVTNLGILTTDNDVLAGTTVPGPDPAVTPDPVVTVRSNPVTTDRQTILQIDPGFTPISLAVNKINPTGTEITIADVDYDRFTPGEIYFIASSLGGTFGTVTSKENADGAVGPNSTLTFAEGDELGLNVAGDGGRIETISDGGTLVTSLQRMKIIHYYIDTTGRLMRRVFGVRGASFRENAIAEHVVSVQFLYSLGPDGDGVIAQPVNRLSNLDQQIAVRQVEVTVTVETPHTIAKHLQPQLTNTTSTSVRNMQFRRALQPTANP